MKRYWRAALSVAGLAAAAAMVFAGLALVAIQLALVVGGLALGAFALFFIDIDRGPRRRGPAE